MIMQTAKQNRAQWDQGNAGAGFGNMFKQMLSIDQNTIILL